MRSWLNGIYSYGTNHYQVQPSREKEMSWHNAVVCTVVCFSTLLMSTWLVAMSWVQIPDNLLHDIVLICFVNLLSSRWSHIDTNLFSFRFSSSCFLCFVLVVFYGKTRAGQLSLVPGPLAVWNVSILYGNAIFVYTCGKCCMRPGNKPKVNSGGKFTIMITSSLVPRPLLHLGIWL